MNELVLLKKTQEGPRTSVHGHFDYGCKYCIAPLGEQMLRKRGFHMTDEEIRDMLHNLPEEFEDSIRVIKDINEVKKYVAPSPEKVEETNEIKEEVAEFIAEKTKEIEKIIGGSAKELPNILKVEYKELNDDMLYEYKLQLKQYAKDNNIKIHPALKDVAKIIEAIKKG